MQLWPIDILRYVFSLVPNDLPKIARVCKRFRFVETDDALWAIRLKTRFNITKIPPDSLYKEHYKLCFYSMLKLRSFIIPAGQQDMGSVRPLQSGFTTEMSFRVDDAQILEIRRNVLTLKNRTQIICRWTLVPSTYIIKHIHGEYWTIQSPASTYLLNIANFTCDLLANAPIDVSIRGPYLLTVGETTLNVHRIVDKAQCFTGIIFFNNKKHIYHLDDGDIAFLTIQQQLILISNDIKIYNAPSFFEPQARLNETNLIVSVNQVTCIFDLEKLKIIPLDLGSYSFRTSDCIAFYKNAELIICNKNLKVLFKYLVPNNQDILHIDNRFVLLKPTHEPDIKISSFNLLNLTQPGFFAFRRRANLIFIGAEGFYLLFARLNDTTLEIMCFNPLNLEFFTPIRLIQNYQFKSATRISNHMGRFEGDYLVVTYFEYMIKVQAVLSSHTGEYKITTYHYKY